MTTASELETWLATKSEAVRQSARLFPPGAPIVLDGTTMFVVSYGDDGSLGVTEIDPAEDYDLAMATRRGVCASCVTSGE